VLLAVLIVMLPLVLSIENCEKIAEPQDIPCRVVSAWNYTPSCNSQTARIHNNSGHNVYNFTFQDYGTSGLCFFNFNVSTIGSYTITVGNGDNAELIVRYVNMQIGIMIGIGIIIALFMFLAFKLDKSHNLLRLIFIFFSVALLSIIPAVYLVDDITSIFHKLIMGFVTVFWLYVAGYVIYWIYGKFIEIIGKKQ